MVEEISGEGSASFFWSSMKHSMASILSFYITVASQGEENLENQENSRIGTPSFLFVWSSDPGRSTLGCDFMISRNPRAWSLGVLFSVKGGGECEEAKKPWGQAPQFFFSILLHVCGVLGPCFPLRSTKTSGLGAPSFLFVSYGV